MCSPVYVCMCVYTHVYVCLCEWYVCVKNIIITLLHRERV